MRRTAGALAIQWYDNYYPVWPQTITFNASFTLVQAIGKDGAMLAAWKTR